MTAFDVCVSAVYDPRELTRLMSPTTGTALPHRVRLDEGGCFAVGAVILRSCVNDYCAGVCPVAATYADLATMWRRGFVRCMLSGDGATYRLTLLDADRVLRCVPTSDERMILTIAEAWLREHEHQAAREPRGVRTTH